MSTIAKIAFVHLSIALIFVSPVTTFGKTLQEAATYPQFQSLIKRCIAEAPYLKGIWEGWGIRPGAKAYVWGGFVRRCVDWVGASLKTQTFSELNANFFPPYADILSDRDIDLVGEFNRHPPHFDGVTYDYLSEDFYSKSILTGGAAIDFVRVNPYKIEDPADGLKEYYLGHLKVVFANNNQIRNAPSTAEINFSRTVEAINALRISQDLAEAQLTESDWNSMRQLATDDEEFFDISRPHRHWVGRAMFKLFKSVNMDHVQALVLIRHAGLLNFIAKHGFQLVGKNFVATDHKFAGVPQADLPKVHRRLVREGFSETELADAEALLQETFPNSRDDRLRILLAKGQSGLSTEEKTSLIRQALSSNNYVLVEAGARLLAQADSSLIQDPVVRHLLSHIIKKFGGSDADMRIYIFLGRSSFLKYPEFIPLIDSTIELLSQAVHLADATLNFPESHRIYLQHLLQLGAEKIPQKFFPVIEHYAFKLQGQDKADLQEPLLALTKALRRKLATTSTTRIERVNAACSRILSNMISLTGQIY